MEGTAMELKLIDIIKPDEVNVVLGQSHFIKTNGLPGSGSCADGSNRKPFHALYDAAHGCEIG